MRTGSLILLLAAACGPTVRLENPKSGPLKVEWQAVGETEWVEGELATLSIRIANATPDYVLLLKLEPADASPALHWQEAREGRIRYDGGLDEYVYRPREEDVTEPVFNTGLLCPGETIAIRVRLRLLNLPAGLTLHYRSYTPESLSRDVYFHAATEYGDLRFRHLVGSDLRNKLFAAAEPDRATHRTVLFPHSLSGVWKREVLAVDRSLRPRDFTLQEAGEKIGVAAGPVRYTFFSTLDAWAIQQERKAWLVNHTWVKPVAPAIRPEALYQFLDAVDGDSVEVEFRDETKSLFPKDVKLIPAFRKGRHRWIAFVRRADWTAFLEKVGEYGLALDVETEQNEGRLLVVKASR